MDSLKVWNNLLQEREEGNMSASGCKNVKCLNKILSHSESYHFWLLPESAVKTQSVHVSSKQL